jgi:hypothetical protein
MAYKPKVNEKLYIELYNAGKTPFELAELFDMSERSINRYEKYLRTKKKIKFRNELPIVKKESNYPKFREEIEPLDWKIIKSNVKASDKKPFKSYLVIGDSHVPYINKPTINAILPLCADVIFDGFIVLGDFMDMEGISHWLSNKRKTLENKRMKLIIVFSFPKILKKEFRSSLRNSF